MSQIKIDVIIQIEDYMFIKMVREQYKNLQLKSLLKNTMENTAQYYII